MIPDPQRNTPWWFAVMLLITVLPVFQTPMLLDMAHPSVTSVRLLIWGYPVYVLMSVWLSWLCYRRYRTLLAWIMLILAWLSAIAVYGLASASGEIYAPF